MRQKRTITDEEKKYLLSIKADDMDLPLLQSLFADKYDRKLKKVIPSKFNTYDEIKLKKGEYINDEDIITNCGLLIINIFLIEPEFKDILGYCNNPLTKEELGKITSKLDTALMEDRITTKQYIDGWLNRKTWLEFSFNTEITTSLTIKSMIELPVVKKEKEKLIMQYKDVLTSDDNTQATVTSTKIEKELIDVAKKEMKDDPSIDLYNSGARGAFDVAYKNSQIMKGPVFNSSKGKFEIVYNPLSSGISKTDLPAMANSVVDSQYSKSIATGDCGYITKKLNAAFQACQIDKKGSDCHSKGYDIVHLTPGNYNFYSYNYIIDGDKLVRYDSQSKDKYIGKTVKMRSNAYCLNSSKTCNMCAGDKFYLIDKPNYGLTVGKLSNALLNKRMKQFHDSTVHSYAIDINNDFL